MKDKPENHREQIQEQTRTGGTGAGDAGPTPGRKNRWADDEGGNNTGLTRERNWEQGWFDTGVRGELRLGRSTGTWDAYRTLGAQVSTQDTRGYSYKIKQEINKPKKNLWHRPIFEDSRLADISGTEEHPQGTINVCTKINSGPSDKSGRDC